MNNPGNAGHRHPYHLKHIAIAFLFGGFNANGQEAESKDEHHKIDEIVVSASALGQSIKQLAQPTTVLDGDALAAKQSTSIGETLANELGVSSSYFGPVASRPVIRGQFGERVRVLSNSLDAMDASALSEDHSVGINSLLAQQIEIVRGPATLLYGSGAAGGLVNVVDNRIVERPLEVPVAGALSLGTDSATGKQSGAAKVAFGNSTIATHFDYYRLDTDDVKIPGFAESAVLRALEEEEEGEEEHEHEHEEEFGSVANTDSETQGGAAAITLTGENGFLGMSLSLHDSNYGIPAAAHGHEEHGHEDGEEEEEEVVRVDLEQTRVDLKGEYRFAGAIEKARFRFATNNYTHTEIEGGEIGTVFNSDGIDARLEFKHSLIENLDGTFGVQYKSIDFEAIGDEAFVPPSETDQISLFVFEEYLLSDAWVLQGSARAEWQTIEVPALERYDDSAFGVSVGAIWSFSNSLSLSANLVHSERHPNSTELYSNGAHLAVGRFERGSVVLGSGQLGKELSTNLDLTLRGGSDRIEFALTGFVNEVDDYILLAATGIEEDDLPVFDYVQKDVSIVGIEAEARVELMDSGAGHLHARLFSDLVNAEEKGSGAYLPRIPPLRYGFGLHYVRDGLGASLDAIFHEAHDNTSPNELPTDSYTMLNAELSYSIADPDLLVFVRGTNLANEDARQSTSPLKDTFPLPARSLHIGIRYDF